MPPCATTTPWAGAGRLAGCISIVGPPPAPTPPRTASARHNSEKRDCTEGERQLKLTAAVATEGDDHDEGAPEP